MTYNEPARPSLSAAPARRTLTCVWLLGLVVLCAAVGIVAARGSVLRLVHTTILGGWLLFTGFALQIALEYIEFAPERVETSGYGLLMASYVFLIAFALANLPVRGMGIVTLGIALNALVIGLNLGMPSRPVALDRDGNRIARPIEQSVKHRPSSSDDILGFLGDKILPPEPINELLSVGDLTLALGIGKLTYFASRKPYQRRHHGAYRTRSRAPRRSRTRSSAASTRPSYT